MIFKGKQARSLAYLGHVSGRVQSVAFRFFTRQEATQLRLTGWVRNLPDGRVEFHVQGNAAAVEEFLAWVRVGPPLARVAEVELEPVEPQDLLIFEVR